MLAPSKIACLKLRHRLCSFVAFTGMIVGMWLSAPVMGRAQAPAGPNRPAQVPEDYVVTPFGYFHPSCVVHLAKGEELLEGGQMVQKADGTIYDVPVCEYPHYTARGDMFGAESPIDPPSISHSWIISGDTVTNTSYGEIAANWSVPSAPQSYDDQTIYFFPGLENAAHGVSILQPVLGWNADFARGWGIASWNCCLTGIAHESSPVPVNPGDMIVGTVKSTCAAGTLACPLWKVTTEDQSTGGNTTLNNTPSEGQTFNWAFGGVVEVYNVVQCSDYPPNGVIIFSPTLYDNNFNIIGDVNWELHYWAQGLTPQCDYEGSGLPSAITLYYSDLTLTVSVTGEGDVYTDDGLINCPSNCMASYPAYDQIGLYATAASGWSFSSWGGACSGSISSCYLTMDQNASVSATFTQNTYTLTVSATGNGTITSTDHFINCPGYCSHVYLSNTVVTLTANPAPGWSLNTWGGACSGNNQTCTVTMTGNESVSATFTQNYYTLTVSPSGQGTITSTDTFINCPGICSHTYLSLTQVTLNASPAQGWNFQGWSGACSGIGPCNLTMLGNYGVSAYFLQPGSGLQFNPVTPCRLVDTRTGNGGGGPIMGGTYQTFNLPQLAQTKGCADLSSAAAYSLNVTLVPQNGSPVSYLTIWPAGLAQPMTSTMNSLDGRIKANAAIVPGGASSSVNVYVTNTTDVVIDIDGFFAPSGQSSLVFYPLTPCRVADTRKDNFPQGLGTPHLSAGVARDFPVLNATSCNIPSNAQAYSLNFTAIPYPNLGDQLGYLEVWPTGQQPQHPVSTLNNPTGTFVANAAIAPAGTGNDITVYTSSDTDLAIDINGYFAAPGTGGLSLYPAPPCRVIDTRKIGNGQPFGGLLSPPIDVVGSLCAPPATAQAYTFNATVVPSPSLSYLTLWPDGQNQPVVSTLNAVDGWITSNMAIVPSTNGSVDAYAAGVTQLILDISAYFAP